MFELRITHIDRGAGDFTLDDNDTGRWPKVSFSNGETLSYLFITNTKILFATARFQDLDSIPYYEHLIKEFMKTDRPFNESNWKRQPRRENNWTPEQVPGGVEREAA